VRIWPALAADVICILVFAIVGRSSHDESTNLTGVLHTAWPFLAGYLVGLLVSRGWRAPLARPVAVTVWVSTVAVGMLLRALTGAGVQLSFVIVASIVLAAMLLGWRGVFSLVQRARSRSGQRARV
jgi:peptidoglycan/LPS O-acetylase OafA/YrhL